ncbi:MAG: tetratricopeptide repeat protein [Phycisphaerales bacterium]|nr:tetratricopeptide repeat protein [Phycisphaerales bacterium]
MAKNKKKKKKKQKLNVRMIAIISASALVLVLVVGGLLAYQYLSRNDRNIRAGDQYYAEGNYNQARKFYGRVIYREPDNAEVLDKLISTYNMMVPLTIEEALEFYGEKQGALMQRAKNTGVREENYLEMAADAYVSARLTNLAPLWSRLEAIADEMILPGRFPKDSEAYAMGKLYVGLCQLRLRDGEMTENIDIDGKIHFPGEDELLEHLALRPDSDEGLANLAFGRLAVARKLGLEGRYGQEQKNLVIAEEAFEDAITRSPEGVSVALMVMRDLYIRKLVQDSAIQNDSASVSEEEILDIETRLQESLDHAEAVIARDLASIRGKSEEQHVLVTGDAAKTQTKLFELLSFMPRIDREAGHERAIVLLETYLAAYPHDDRMRMSMAQSCRAIGEYAAARRHAQHVIDGEQKTISLAATEQFGMRATAANLLFDIAYEQWLIEDIDEKDEAFQRVAETRAALDHFLGGNKDSALALNADARIAMGQERFREAAKLFERQIFIDSKPTSDTLRAAAYSLERSNQTGLALERLDQAILVDPMGLRHYIAKAQLLGRMGRPGQAIRVLESLPRGLQSESQDIMKLKDSLRMLSREEAGDESMISDPVLRLVREADECIRRGQPEEAQAVLFAATSEDGDTDYRILGALAQTYSILGEYDMAVETIERALAIEPGNELLLSIERICRNTSPIDRVRMEVDLLELPSDEATVNLYISFHALAKIQEAQASMFDRARLSDQADEARAVAESARAEAAALEEQIKAMPVEESPALFEHEFSLSIEEQDWDRVEELIILSRQGNLDESNGNLSEARYHRGRAAVMQKNGDVDGSRSQLIDAASAARRATEVASWSDMNWLTLGLLLDDLGNTEEAMEAYEEAYRRNPGRQTTIFNYTKMLMDPVSGEPLRALGILREAKELHPNSPVIREAWLQVEAEIGDKGIALAQRERIFDRQPESRINAMRLAELVAGLTPDRQYIIDKISFMPITARQWNSMSMEARTQALLNLKREWTERLASLLAVIESYPDQDLSEAMTHASIYREIKDPDSAVRVIRNYLESAVDSPNYIQEVLVAAQFFAASDRLMEAADLLMASRARQSKDGREVDYALGMMHFQSGTARQAIPYFRAVLQVRDSSAVRNRLVQALIMSQRFQEAGKELEVMQSDGIMTYDLYMLNALLENARAEAAIAIGDRAAQAAARAKYLACLEQANVLDPEQLSPYVSLVNSLISDYAIERDPVMLDQALAVVSRGIERLPNSEVLVAKRADVLEARGELNAATMDLEQMSRKYPDSIPIRERLIIAYLKADSLEKAQEAITDGIALMPAEGTWYEALGDYYSSIAEPNLSLATEAYLNAYQREPSRAILYKINTVTRTTAEWDYDAMISLFQQEQFGLARDPVTIGLYARSLAGKGAYERASTQMRTAYEMLQKQIQDKVAPAAILPRWYEDLFVVFGRRDGQLGEQLAMELSGPEPSYWDRAGLAQYWSLRGDETGYDRAIELQSELVEFARRERPEDLPMTLSRLGNYQISRGQTEESLASFQEIVELKPDNAQALNNYAYVLATTMNRPEEALPMAKRAVEADPRSLEILDTMAAIYDMLGRHEEALSSRLRLHQLYPTDLNTLLSIIATYDEHLDDPSKSMEFAELAMRIKPGDPGVLDAMGWASYRTGQVMKGEDLIRQSIRLSPSVSAHLHMAQMFIDREEPGKARDQLQLAYDLGPDDETKAEIKRLKDDIAGS